MRRISTALSTALSGLILLAPLTAHSGAQKYEPLSASVQASLHRAIADQAAPVVAFDDEREARAWLAAMSSRLEKKIPDRVAREEFLLTVHYEARRAGHLLELSPTEFTLLRYLLINADRVVSKAQILDHVWDYDFGGDAGIVETYISYLRKKIDIYEPPLIHTVRGVGYRLRLPAAK